MSARSTCDGTMLAELVCPSHFTLIPINTGALCYLSAKPLGMHGCIDGAQSQIFEEICPISITSDFQRKPSGHIIFFLLDSSDHIVKPKDLITCKENKKIKNVWAKAQRSSYHLWRWLTVTTHVSQSVSSSPGQTFMGWEREARTLDLRITQQAMRPTR